MVAHDAPSLTHPSCLLLCTRTCMHKPHRILVTRTRTTSFVCYVCSVLLGTQPTYPCLLLPPAYRSSPRGLTSLAHRTAPCLAKPSAHPSFSSNIHLVFFSALFLHKGQRVRMHARSPQAAPSHLLPCCAAVSSFMFASTLLSRACASKSRLPLTAHSALQTAQHLSLPPYPQKPHQVPRPPGPPLASPVTLLPSSPLRCLGIKHKQQLFAAQLLCVVILQYKLVAQLAGWLPASITALAGVRAAR